MNVYGEKRIILSINMYNSLRLSRKCNNDYFIISSINKRLCYLSIVLLLSYIDVGQYMYIWLTIYRDGFSFFFQSRRNSNNLHTAERSEANNFLDDFKLIKNRKKHDLIFLEQSKVGWGRATYTPPGFVTNVI